MAQPLLFPGKAKEAGAGSQPQGSILTRQGCREELNSACLTPAFCSSLLFCFSFWQDFGEEGSETYGHLDPFGIEKTMGNGDAWGREGERLGC